MPYQKLITYVLVMGLVMCLSGCLGLKPETPRPGIDEPLESNGFRITILEAEIRLSFSTYYIMNYPADNQVFYAVTASLEGFENPKTALEWGKNNLKLVSGNQEQNLAYAQWVTVGEDIQYKAGEVFTYQYLFYFNIPRDLDYASYRLKLSTGQWVETSEILQSVPLSSTDQPDDQPSEMISPVEGILQAATGQFATVGGGSKNSSSAYHTTVAGGYLNVASAAYGSVGGGRENQASNLYTTIAGGYGNTASGRDTSIGGGSRNTASNYHATIGGGIRNQANASDSTIGGGAYNLADQPYAVVGGGNQNIASGTAAVVGGGAGNLASNNQSTISGGLGNQATGNYTMVGGGYSNIASGDYSVIPGGSLNQAHGDYSFSVGRRSWVSPDHPGVILFSDSTDSDFRSTRPDEFGVRATGGIRFVTAVDASGGSTAGVILPSGSGSWSNLSDRNFKENILPVNPGQILESVIALPLTEWNYISQGPSIRHIGPMADDFYSAFGIGEDPRHISNIDADGISLAAIQGVYQLIEEKNQQITDLEIRVSSLEKRANHLLIIMMVSLALITLGISILIHNSLKHGYAGTLVRPKSNGNGETNS